MTLLRTASSVLIVAELAASCDRVGSSSDGGGPAGDAPDVADGASADASLVAQDGGQAARDAQSDDAADGAALDATLTVHYGACFGDCREYTLTFTSDGTLRGLRKPRQVGLHETAAIFDLARRAFVAPPHCGILPTDAQRVTVTLREGAHASSRTYVAGYPCTPLFTELEHRLQASK
jgi:hypothetical protein